MVPAADPPRRGHWARSASYLFGAPLCGCPWRVPPASVLGVVCCGGFACLDPVTHASALRRGCRPVHRGCFVWTPAPPLAGRRAPRRGPMRACVCACFVAGSGGAASRARSGAPHLSFGRSRCLLCLLCPLRAQFALLALLPSLLLLCGLFLLRPFWLGLSFVSGPRCPGPWHRVGGRFLAVLWSLVSLVCCASCRFFPSFFPLFVSFLLRCLALWPVLLRSLFLAPPSAPAFFCFRPQVPWALALCGWPFLCFAVASSLLLIPVVALGVACGPVSCRVVPCVVPWCGWCCALLWHAGVLVLCSSVCVVLPWAVLCCCAALLCPPPPPPPAGRCPRCGVVSCVPVLCRVVLCVVCKVVSVCVVLSCFCHVVLCGAAPCYPALCFSCFVALLPPPPPPPPGCACCPWRCVVPRVCPVVLCCCAVCVVLCCAGLACLPLAVRCGVVPHLALLFALSRVVVCGCVLCRFHRWCAVLWCVVLFGVALCRVMLCYLCCVVLLRAAPPAIVPGLCAVLC